MGASTLYDYSIVISQLSDVQRVDIEQVARWAGENIEDVVVARDYKFMCSSLGQQMIEEDIKTKGLTRVVVAAC